MVYNLVMMRFVILYHKRFDGAQCTSQGAPVKVAQRFIPVNLHNGRKIAIAEGNFIEWLRDIMADSVKSDSTHLDTKISRGARR